MSLCPRGKAFRLYADIYSDRSDGIQVIMENKKIKTFEIIMLLTFFIGTIIFIGVLMYFSKPQEMQSNTIISVEQMLAKISSEDAEVNREDVDYIADVKTVLSNPKDYINRLVSWQGKIIDVSDQNYKGASIKFLKILTDDSSEFIAGIKSSENFNANDVILVKGIIKGIYAYKDNGGSQTDVPVLKCLEFEIKKIKPAQKPTEVKSPSAENITPTPEEFKMQTPAYKYTPLPSVTSSTAQPKKEIAKPKPSPTVEAKKTPKVAPSYEYQYSSIMKLDEKYLKIAESYDQAKNKQKALRYYKKYLEVAPSGPQAEAAKNKVKELESK